MILLQMVDPSSANQIPKQIYQAALSFHIAVMIRSSPKVSKPLGELLIKMLDADPDCRLSIDQVLESEWVTVTGAKFSKDVDHYRYDNLIFERKMKREQQANKQRPYSDQTQGLTQVSEDTTNQHVEHRFIFPAKESPTQETSNRRMTEKDKEDQQNVEFEMDDESQRQDGRKYLGHPVGKQHPLPQTQSVKVEKQGVARDSLRRYRTDSFDNRVQVMTGTDKVELRELVDELHGVTKTPKSGALLGRSSLAIRQSGDSFGIPRQRLLPGAEQRPHPKQEQEGVFGQLLGLFGCGGVH